MKWFSLIITSMVLAITACKSDLEIIEENASYFDYYSSGMLGARQSVLIGRKNDGSFDFITAKTEPPGTAKHALTTIAGWSTTQPIILNMHRPKDVSLATPLDEKSNFKKKPYYILEYQQTALVPTPKQLSYQRTLQEGIDYTTQITDHQLLIVPMKPLKPQHGYLVVLTNLWKDNANTFLKADPRYIQARDQQDPWVTFQEQAFLENLKNDGQSLSRQEIIFSDFVFTQDSNESIQAVYMAYQAIIENNDGSDTVWDTPKKAFFNLDISKHERYIAQLKAEPYFAERQAILNKIYNDVDAQTLAHKIFVHSGYVTLPYFLQTPKSAQTGSWGNFLNMPWQAATSSLYTLQQTPLKQGRAYQEKVDGYLDKYDVNANNLFSLNVQSRFTEMCKLIGTSLESDSQSSINPNRWINQFNILPQLTDLAQVPIRIFSSAPLDDVNEWIIFQHGVGAHKFQAYPLALRLAAFEQSTRKKGALVAIDHPLHGERAITLANSSTINATENPAIYINLKSLLAGRDNLKQSSVDLVGLRAALRKAYPGKPVHIIGHSLGALTALNTLAVTDQTPGGPLSFSSAVLAMPGAGIAPLLINSKSFGPGIKRTVLLSAMPEVATAFKQACPQQTDECFMKQFMPSLPKAQQTKAQAVLSQFQYATQTILDSADPINSAAQIRKNLPIYGIEIIGDGQEHLSDQVIPNSVPGVPYAGTEPLFAALGLTLTNSSILRLPARHFARFLKGSHGSLIGDLIYPEVSEEIQLQALSLAMGDQLIISKSEFMQAPVE